MNFSDETVMAYADGELDAASRAAVEAAMATDPQLAQRVARHRALRERLRAALDPVLDEPPPERLLEGVRGAPAPRRAANVVALKRKAAPRWSWPQWGAIAASLVGGVLLGPLLLRAPAGAALVTRDGQVLASGVLARALTEQLASDQPRGAPVQIGVSFRARNGDYCRTFVLREQSALAGLACRGREAWRLEVLAQTPAQPAAAADYRPAGSALPASVARTLDELIAGEPLDAAGETGARARGWKP
ncbi:MAG: hypothetical protein E6K23_03330 [Gammaproteobacteria bacterium]|nr:MAG: hypothetical protein E6K40_17905 [Gammaproteobacteria bacterium]TLZ42450.1 MAG: hypothetical protein E6K23_03330 [Gammaproteobacteria bacterium]